MELEQALERERQLLMSQGDCDDDDTIPMPNTKISVVEDVPWRQFVDEKFGAAANVNMREYGRVAAVNIQKMLRGFLVRKMMI
jgi:hypothetical protein